MKSERQRTLPHPITRRDMLRRCSTGFGLMALSGLMTDKSYAGLAPSPTSRRTHFAPHAKNVIFCFMSGGVSQVDSFDPKPRLAKEAGQPLPMKVERTMFNNNGNIFPSPFEFKRHGQCGMPISSMFPHIAKHADDLAVIRSMTSPLNEHAQGNYFIHTGFPFMGHPSAGAWVSYGLGTENRNLPGFVVLQSEHARAPHGGVGNFSAGFLPAQHQASIINADNPEAIRNIVPKEVDLRQRLKLDFVRKIDRNFSDRVNQNPQVEAAVRNYETAYLMQTAIPELCDLQGESAETKSMYGLDTAHEMTRSYARQCLLARRMVERGVRFIELSCLPQNRGDGQSQNPWDQHGGLEVGHTNMARQVDQPIGALLQDLKQRGLFDQTLVIWSGEFGRTPFSQGSNGRDHNPYGFSIWMAGGGIKGGRVLGQTDEYGYHVVGHKYTFYDLWATTLHQLGIDHEQLTYRFGGRDLRLTDVHGNVIHDIVA